MLRYGTSLATSLEGKLEICLIPYGLITIAKRLFPDTVLPRLKKGLQNEIISHQTIRLISSDLPFHCE